MRKRVLVTSTDLMMIQFLVPHVINLSENGFDVEIAGASEETLREDGSLEVELQVLTGATNETGFNKLSAR